MSNYTSFNALRAGLGASKRQEHNRKYVYVDFHGEPTMWEADQTVAAGVNVKNDLLYIDGENFQIYYENTCTAAATVATFMTKGVIGGMTIITDAADNDGLLISQGRTLAADGTTADTTGHGAFTIGTDADFFFRVKLSLADVSDTDDCFVGFAVGAPPDPWTSATETDIAGFNINVGNVEIVTRLNSGSASAIDTTTNVIDDAGSEANAISLEVRVGAGGAVKFLINDVAPATDVTGFTFDNADVVHAFLGFVANTTSAPTPTLFEWEQGFMSSRGLENVADLNEASQSTVNA